MQNIRRYLARYGSPALTLLYEVYWYPFILIVSG